MIELRDVLNIHNILIDKFGGSKGIRDYGSLESAINTDLVSVLVQSALRLIVLNSYSLGIYHCMISSTA